MLKNENNGIRGLLTLLFLLLFSTVFYSIAHASHSATVTKTDVTCGDSCDGTAKLTITGGTGPFHIEWYDNLGNFISVADTTTFLSGLCSSGQPYTVFVQDSGDVDPPATQVEVPFFIQGPGPMILISSTITNATCSDSCNGKISATFSGGTAPRTYSWSNGFISAGGSSSIATALCSGNYTVTVTDANGCTKLFGVSNPTFTVTKPSPVVATATRTDVNCNSACNGTAQVSGSGGTPGYTFSWSNGSTASSLSSLCANTYTVTVTDTKGCISNSSVIITEPGALTITASGTNDSCFAACKGTLTSSATGGSSPYTYNWGFATGANQTNVCAGTYILTVTDTSGCSTSDTVIITQPAALVTTVTATQDSCQGACKGTLSGSTAGGTSPYTYSWSGGPGTSTGANKTNVCAGTYTITTTDTNSCITTTSVTVTEPGLLSVSVASTNNTCNGTCNGTLTATGSGGTSPYTYSWSGGLGTGSSKSGVCAGTYTVTITDANNCTATLSGTITPPAVLIPTVSSTPVTCFGVCNGTLSVTATGGTSPYGFVWIGGLGAGNSKTNVCTGTYSVTCTDANGCTAIASGTVGTPTVLNVTATAINPTCSGSCNGTVNASGTGGTTGYSYSWSGGLGTGSTITGICAGTYSVTCTDANSCTATVTITVTQPVLLSVSIAGTNITCNGLNNGKAKATPSGGTTPYSYNWSTSAAVDSIENLAPGTYTLTVTDTNGCSVVQSVSITQPATLTTTITSANITCNGTNDGTATSNPAGGTTAYTYLWNSGQTTKTINSLSAGTYTVTVTDSKGCTTLQSVTITNPSSVSTGLVTINETCNGQCNGKATVSPSGGTSPYTTQWALPIVSSTDSATGLCPGSYSVTIFDNNNCNVTQSFTITGVAVLSPAVTVTNINCFGNNNGAAISNPTGGNTGGYSYSWSNSKTTQSITGLAAGNYSVTVSDPLGCTGTQTVTVTSPSQIASGISGTNPVCSGVCNGTVSVSPSGGVSGYTLLWSNGPTTTSQTGLCPGSYTVTITDAAGCTISANKTLIIPNPIIGNPTSSNASCDSMCNGSAAVAPSGGTPGYAFSWSNGGTTSSKTGLCAGTYTVTITDAASCFLNHSFSITQPSPVSVSTVTIGATCSSIICDGSSTATASGGNTSYTYLWSNSSTGATVDSLCAGSYTVTSTDNLGCTGTGSVSIVGIVNIQINTTIVNEDCNNLGCDGTASAKALGGTAPYTFLWSVPPSQVTNFPPDSSFVSALCVGTYYITATDSAGCSDIDSITMTISPLVFIVKDSAVSVSCNGNSDGKAFALTSGGTLPYTYIWSNGSTNSSITGLSAGTYKVTVNDAGSCKDSVTVIVSAPAILDASATGTNISCNGACNGTASASATGGTTPYSFLWSSGSTAGTADSLCPGTYIVTITDARGCTDTSVVSITQPSALVATTSSTQPNCNGNSNGTATLIPGGGTTPYTYLWSASFQTTSIATGLAAGTYTVTVTDNKSCTIATSVTVGQPSALTLSTSKTDISCNGSCNGTITSSASGGTPSYIFNWSNSQTSSIAANLCPGNFTVTITDSKGCSVVSSTVTITEPSVLTASVSSTPASCNGTCNGSASLTVSGGTTNYSYLWSPSTGSQTTVTATGLCAGAYSVTITDAKGCTLVKSGSLTQPSAFVITPTTQSSNCGVCDGTLNASITGGTPSYTYLWSNGATIKPVTGICAGVYSLTVTDTKSCTAVSTIIVDNISGPDGATISTTNASCNGVCNGSSTVVAVSGGTPGFSYSWPNGSTTTTASGLCAGTYIITITDTLSCKHFETYVVSQPTVINANISTVNATCNGLSNGSAAASPSGSVSPYTFSWSTGAISASLSGLAGGNYPLTVTDSKGCTKLDTAVVGQGSSLSVTFSKTNVVCNGAATGSMTATLAGGTSPYTYTWNNSQTGITATALAAGTYNVTITDQKGCTVAGTDSITQPNAISDNTTTTNTSCGSSTGTASAAPSGGTSPYTYLWGNGQTTSSASGLSAGVTSLDVSDASGCSKSFSVPINNTSGPSASNTITNATCKGVCNGIATVTASGGTSPYSYLWTPGGQTTNSRTGLCKGTYYLQVTDSIGCATIDTIVITEPVSISASFSKTEALCNGNCNGTAVVAPSGGVVPYTYSWETGDTSQSVNNLCVGTYTVTITGGNGCQAVDSVTITQPTTLTVSASATATSCNSFCNGSATASAAGGTGPYTYTWSNGGSGSLTGSLCTATYSVTATDAKSCTAISSVTVTQPTAVSVPSAIISQTTCNSCNGSISITPAGGTSPYTYSWSGGQTTSILANLCTNPYTVTVTDTKGCTGSQTYAVNPSNGPQPQTSNTDVPCFGQCNGLDSAMVTGGTSPYTFLWNDVNAQTNSTATGLCAGTYQVFVTDSTGCTGIGVDTVNQPLQLSLIKSVADSSCNTLCDVSATVTASGGTSPYSFAWSTGSTSSAVTGLCSGTYYLTITDNKLCTRTDSIVVVETSTLSVNLTTTNSNCNISCDGFITAGVTGGTSPYLYSWSNGGSSFTISNLCAGNYSVTVTDNKGCSVIKSDSVIAPSALTAPAITTAANCNSSCDGSVASNATGGTTPYTFIWSPGNQTSATATGLCAGVYSVTVLDAKGCSVISSSTVSQPSPLVLDSSSATATSCNQPNGNATVYMFGGTTPYSYNWSGSGQTTQTASGLVQGVYSVTVTYNSSCSKTYTGITVGNTNGPGVTIVKTDLSCNGGICNGTATATVTGTSPFTYQWQGGQTSSTVTGLCTGTIRVTVTDINTCFTIDSVTIGQPSVLTISSTSTDILCSGNSNGTVTTTVSGGTSPYSYSWSNGATSSSVTGLSGGIYCVTVNDSKGCTVTVCDTVNAPVPLTLNTVFTNDSCNASCKGTAAVTATGGTGPYTYLWSNASTSSFITGLCAGNYNITVTDSNNCSITNTISISQPSVINGAISSTSPTCGNSNGNASITASGGTPFVVSGYNYLWTGGQTSATITGLTAGSFSVTVTDSLGCKKSFTTNLSNPTGPVITVDSVVHVKCFNQNSGGIYITATGINPLTYSWNYGPLTDDVNGLVSGTYTVTVSDSSLCQAIQSFTVSQPSVLAATVTTTSTTCGNCNGKAAVFASGGTGPYTYLWSNLIPGDSISGICPATYTVTSTDVNGCKIVVSGTVSNIAGPDSVITTSNNVNCYGDSTGSATAAAAGGSSPFTYQWSNGSVFATASGLKEGIYAVTATDSSGCFAIDTVTIIQPAALVLDSVSITQPNCGAPNGSAKVNISGGTTPYSYQWDVQANNQTNVTATALAAANYSVTVTYSGSCSQVFSVPVSNINAPVITLIPKDVSCGGNCNGNVSAQVSGGTTPYSYLWSNGGTNTTITGLCAATYTFTVTDAPGCISIKSVNVGVSTTIAGTMSSTNISCNGDSTGTAAVAMSGGITPYTYLWSNTATSASLSNLKAGTYTVTVTDSVGCTYKDSVSITQPAALSLVNTVSNINCNISCNGAVAAAAAGGVSPYSYLWSNGKTTSSITGLCANTYSLTLTDSSSCKLISTVTITETPALQLDSFSVVKPSCNTSTGQATVNVSGGASPFSYQWDSQTGSQTGVTATALAAGTYTVSVTYNMICVDSFKVSISNINAPVVTFAVTGTSCGGTCDGKIIATASGGVMPYSYKWSSGQTTDTVQNVCIGLYQLTVTDTNGCVHIDTVSMSGANLLAGTISAVNAQCKGLNNGSATANVTGGSAPYTYIWSTGGTVSVITGLSPGTYIITVTDSTGCTFKDSVLITEPGALSALPNVTNALCNGVCNGSVSLAVSGGTSPYSYLWSNGSTSNPDTAVCAGTLTVTVTDNKGCTIVNSALVGEPSAISATVTVNVAPSCLGNNGSATASASGGISPYSYLWSVIPVQTTANATGLAAGNYTVSVTDSNGCKTVKNISLSNPGATVTADSIKNISCGGTANGAIYITASGVQPFSYLWSTNATTDDITGLIAGTYSLSVTDSNSCLTTLNVTVTTPIPISATLNATGSSCGFCNGAIVAAANGGTGPLSYLWSNGKTNISIDSLCTGAYFLTISDSTSCSSVFSANINSTGGPDSVLISKTNITCSGFCNGTLSTTVFGGSSPYSYKWSTGDTVSAINGLCSNTYIITVTDKNGCSIVSTTQLQAPSALGASFTTIPPTCGLNNGSASVNVTGGTPTGGIYSYKWLDASMQPIGQTDSTATGLAGGIYSVSVTDVNGCTALFSTTLGNNNATVTTDSIKNASCFGICDGAVSVSVTGTTPPFTFLWIPSAQVTEDANGLCAGAHTLKVTDALGCVTFKDTVVGQPTEISASFTTVNPTCGFCNGKATVSVTGGVSPYSYFWTNDDISATADSLCAGPYQVAVSDNKGCVKTLIATVSNIGGPDSAGVSATNVNCAGNCNGSATVTPFGGKSPYSYFWVGFGNTTSQMSGLCEGTYFVDIQDSNNCIFVKEVTIAAPSSFKDSAVATPPTCGSNNGSISVFISGSTPPYSYIWSNGATVSFISNLSAGIYKLTVTSGTGGCTEVFNYNLSNIGGAILTTTVNGISCNGLCSGQATVTASGGSLPYIYNWSNGSTSTIATGLCAGNYTISVSDAPGCVTIKTVAVSEPDTLSASLPVVTAPLCNGLCDGKAVTVIVGGAIPYSYLWSNGQAASTASGLCSGNYGVTTTDANGCSISQSFAVIQPSPLTVEFDTTDAVCIDDTTGGISLVISGGNSGYTYSWKGPNNYLSTKEDISGLYAGWYFLTITDFKGCSRNDSVPVDTLIIIIANAGKDTTVCADVKSLTLNGSYTGISTVSLSWSNGDTTLSTAITTKAGVTNYIFTVASGVCVSTDTVKVDVKGLPVVEAGGDLTIVKNATTVVGGNPAASGGMLPYSYNWTPGLGLSDSLSANPVATPPLTTIYTLTVITAEGCAGNDSVIVTVVPEIQYNSGFSPNGDGINDNWAIDFVEQFSQMEVDIYNRWGQHLFHSTGYKTQWDGKYEGKELPVGTYYYVINLNHPKFPEPITGPVTIMK